MKFIIRFLDRFSGVIFWSCLISSISILTFLLLSTFTDYHKHKKDVFKEFSLIKEKIESIELTSVETKSIGKIILDLIRVNKVASDSQNKELLEKSEVIINSNNENHKEVIFLLYKILNQGKMISGTIGDFKENIKEVQAREIATVSNEFYCQNTEKYINCVKEEEKLFKESCLKEKEGEQFYWDYLITEEGNLVSEVFQGEVIPAVMENTCPYEREAIGLMCLKECQ